MNKSLYRLQEADEAVKGAVTDAGVSPTSSGFSRSLRGCVIGVALVVVGAVCLFSHLRASPRSPDEQAYLAWAVAFALEGRIAEPDGRNISKNVPPLHTVMVGIAFKSFGVKTEVAQAVSVLGGALSAGVCFLLGYLLMGPRGAVLATVLFVTSGKGEIWEYSNRVLNDIFLLLWVSCILLCAMAYIRWGRLWIAGAMGLFLGLGFLNKESILLAFPVFLAAFVLGGKSKSTRLLHFFTAMVVAACLMAPLVLHRYKSVQLKGKEGAQRYGLRAGNLGTLLDSEKWGFRGLEELGDNILLRGMPSGAFRIIYAASFLACLVLFLKKKAPKELILPILLIFVWIAVFQVLVHLPLTRRQLLPLFPAYNVVAVFVLMSSWGGLRSRIIGGKLSTKASSLMEWAGVLVLAMLNMPPQAWSGMNPGQLLKSPEPGFLEKEAKGALACVPDGARIASNFDRMLYFILKGKVPVFHLETREGQEPRKPSLPKKGKKQRGLEGKEKPLTEGWAFVPPKGSSELLSPLYAIVFYPREPGLINSPPSMEDSWEIICEGERFVVSRWRKGIHPG